jgi:citrate lyase subunit gamma (acyl carrier protein)
MIDMAMLRRPAQAGTLESSDCLVSVAPSETRELDHRGAGATFFAGRTRGLVNDVLDSLGISGATVTIQDQGALEVTLRARLDTALERASREEDAACPRQ